MLILSEFAGAAQSLGAGALQVNPWNISEVADAIHKALTMKEAERQERTAYTFQHVMTHTAKAWAREFVEALETIPVQGDAAFSGSASTASLSSLGSTSDAALTSNQMQATMPSSLDVDGLLASFARSQHRLIITGLAGLVIRASTLTKGAAAAGASTDIRSDYEENAGELWGWRESSPSNGVTRTEGQSQAVGPPGSSVSALPSAAAMTRGPSRYASHTRRVSSFAALPSSAHHAERAMEEWMEMDGEGDAGDHEDRYSGREPSAEELKTAIVALASDPNTTYLLLTSRSREWCDALFASVSEPPANLWFAAENGYFFKHGTAAAQTQPAHPTQQHTPASSGAPQSGLGARGDWHVMYENVDFGWMEGVHRVMTYFCERTPRSYIQLLETSAQWHYGDAEPTFAKRQALDLISHLTGGPLSNTATEVLDSHNIVQVRPLAVSKGRALKHLLAYLHKKYRRRHRPLVRRSDTIASDSDEEQTAAPKPHNADDDGAAARSGLSSAAIQSALHESGVLVARDGENAGYEEDDEGAEEPPHARGSTAKARAPTAVAVSSLSSSPVQPSRSALQIRSRRPSLADPSEHADDALSSGRGSAGVHSLNAFASPTTASASASPSSASSAMPYVPLDFVLCIGSFMERDEDIFPLLNEWADLGVVPPQLCSSQHPAQSQHSTPSRRVSLAAAAASPNGSAASAAAAAASASASASATQPLHGPGLPPPQPPPAAHKRASTTELQPSSIVSPSASPSASAQSAHATAYMSSPQSVMSLSDLGSPSSEASSHFASVAAPSIYTVTVGQHPSRARYALPDLQAVNRLILQLNASAHSTHGHGAGPEEQRAVAGHHEAAAYPDKDVDGGADQLSDKQRQHATAPHPHQPQQFGESGKLSEPTMHS